MKIIGLKGVQDLLGCSRKDALILLNKKTCPLLNKGKRIKGEHYKVFDEELIEWIKRGEYKK